MANERGIEYEQVFPLGIEASYAATIAHASIDQIVSIGPGIANSLEQFPTDQFDNKLHIGKGHNFPTFRENMRWTTEGQSTDVVDTTWLGLLLKIMLGSVSTSTPSGGTDARDHAYVLQPGSNLQLPSTNLVAKDSIAGGYFSYPGIVCSTLNLNGAANGYMQHSAALKGNGKKTAVGGFAGGTFLDHRLLRDSQATFLFGVPDSAISNIDDLVSWNLDLDAGLLLDDAYGPDGTVTPTSAVLFDQTDASKGMIAKRMRFGDRTIGVNFTIKVSDQVAKTIEENNTITEVIITSLGDLIEVGFYDKLTIQMKDVRFTAVRKGEQDGLITFDVTGMVMMPASGLFADLLTITLRNGVAGYPVIAA